MTVWMSNWLAGMYRDSYSPILCIVFMPLSSTYICSYNIGEICMGSYIEVTIIMWLNMA